MSLYPQKKFAAQKQKSENYYYTFLSSEHFQFKKSYNNGQVVHNLFSVQICIALSLVIATKIRQKIQTQSKNVVVKGERTGKTVNEEAIHF